MFDPVIMTVLRLYVVFLISSALRDAFKSILDIQAEIQNTCNPPAYWKTDCSRRKKKCLTTVCNKYFCVEQMIFVNASRRGVHLK